MHGASARPLIVCFAGDTWDGNPHSRHHLLRRLVRDYDVLFVESVPMRSVALGGRYEWRRVQARLGAGRALRTVLPGLHVMRPFPVPPAGRAGRGLQLASLWLEIALAKRRLRLEGDVLTWFSLPNAAPLLRRLKAKASIFYYQDRYDAFSHVDADRLRAEIVALARGCDVTVCSAQVLADDIREMGATPIVIRHGVDVDHFRVVGEEPVELRALEHPLVGCVGLIDDHLSIEAIRAVADRLEHGTVVLIGRTNIDPRPLEHPRIALLGQRPYERLPAYVSSLTCCLVPFALNRLTLAVNPIKLREYLAAGRPVVSTPLPEVLPYRDVVELAVAPSEFADAVQRTLAPGYDDEAARRRRRDRVSGESWDVVAERLREVLADLVPGADRGR